MKTVVFMFLVAASRKLPDMVPWTAITIQPWSRWVNMPLGAFLVQRMEGKNVQVDEYDGRRPGFIVRTGTFQVKGSKKAESHSCLFGYIYNL